MKFGGEIILVFLIWSLLAHIYQCDDSNITAIVLLHGTGKSSVVKFNKFFLEIKFNKKI
jgi:hypothetical protein